MKRAIRAGVLAVALLGAAAAVAQGGPGPARGCPGGPCGGGGGGGPGHVGRRFDPATVTTIRGEIVDVQRIEHRRGAGIHVMVSTGNETLAVHLGPEFYLDNQPVQLGKGDQVEVTGSRIEVSGGPAIVAQQVRRGGEVLALRDESGLPLWRRGRR